MSFDRTLAMIMAKSGGKAIPGNITSNITPDIEWLKWLSYEPDFEKKRMEYLNSKTIAELSYEELEEAMNYKENQVWARLFKLYGTNTCSEEDYMEVYDFMAKENIEDLMLSKLTVEELQYAKKEIIRLSKMPKEQLNIKVKEEQEKYAELSMVDSYILHIISNINYEKNIRALSEDINSQIKRNEYTRQRSLNS